MESKDQWIFNRNWKVGKPFRTNQVIPKTESRKTEFKWKNKTYTQKKMNEKEYKKKDSLNLDVYELKVLEK